MKNLATDTEPETSIVLVDKVHTIAACVDPGDDPIAARAHGIGSVVQPTGKGKAVQILE